MKISTDKNYKKIGKVENYNDKEIEEYGNAIKFIAKQYFNID